MRALLAAISAWAALAVERLEDGRGLLGLDGAANRTLLWSSVKSGNLCSGGHCVVPPGAIWVLDASMDVETLTIEGTLRWDISKDNLELRSQYILVTGHGRLEIGTLAQPMENRATVYIKDGPESHYRWGFRFLSGDMHAEIAIHGRPLDRTWTLLAETAPRGSMELRLKHDPQAMGWRPGDRIGIATTSRGYSTVHRIMSLGPNLVHLDSPLPNEHWGGYRLVVDTRFEMAAEVINLERSVLITGDHEDFFESKLGLHTSIHGTGYADIRYARVEFCGQRDYLGRYCMHFHRMGHCPRCVFKGNAIQESQQVGITVHGTHFSLVEENTIFDARGVGIYTEDGNEMNNTIKQNVMICSWYETCSQYWLNQPIFAGIFLIGMTNDLIENRVIGYENCIWTPGSYKGLGAGHATNRVCPAFTPYGIIRGNVNHDCWRFGLYTDNQFPRNVKRDSNGYLIDKNSCNEFTPDGKDNGLSPANVIENEFDWHNMFVGQYALGDVQFVNYTSVNNAHGMYWKTTKGFADGRVYHVMNSRFYNDRTDKIGLGKLDFMGPAGPFVFGVANTVFAGGPAGCGAICAGQACGLGGGGGPCDVQYLLHNVDFARVEAGSRLVSFGVHCIDQGFVLPMFVADDNSLGGFRSLVSRHLNGFGNEPGCQAAGHLWGGGYGCNRPVRRLNLWGPRSDTVRISGPGYRVAENENAPVRGMNAGKMEYESMNGLGYGTPVLVGETYSIEGNWNGNMVIDFSDQPLANYFGTPNEMVRIQAGGVTCELAASHARNWLSPRGIVPHIIPAHTSIQNGQLLCGGPSGLSVGGQGSVSKLGVGVCGRLSDVKKTCKVGQADCLVLADSAANRTCRDYCAHGHLTCTGGWKEGPQGCSAGEDVGCEEASPESLLCACRALAPVAEEPPAALEEPLAEVPLERFPECAFLANVSKSCSSNGCKALVSEMAGRSCGQYCSESGGLVCAGAWQQAEGCEAKEEMKCNEVREGLSNLICECAVPNAAGEPMLSTSTSTTTAASEEERGSFQIRSRHEGLCLQESRGVSDVARLAPCDHMVTGQQWTLVRSESAAQIRSVRGSCLEGGTRSLLAADCSSSEDQRWTRRLDSGLLELPSGRCLSAVTGTGRLRTSSCRANSGSQLWDFVELAQPVRSTLRRTPGPSQSPAPAAQAVGRRRRRSRTTSSMLPAVLDLLSK